MKDSEEMKKPISPETSLESASYEEKRKTIQNLTDWIWEKDKDKIMKAAFEMWCICPDREYWTPERMKPYLDRP